MLLVSLAILLCRRWLWGLSIIAMLIAGPIMDLRITRPGLFPPDRDSSTIRVLTLNTHFGALDPLKLKALLDQANPDLVALQEWYPRNRTIVFSDARWFTIQLPEAMLASPYPIRCVGLATRDPEISAGTTYHYRVQLPTLDLSFYSVHLSSPHAAFRGVLHLSRYGRAELTINSMERLREAGILQRASDDDTILAGDFNLPRDSTIFRSAFSDLADAFTDAGLGYGLTYYSQWTTIRIDHILMGKNWRCVRCWVGPDLGSPHRPVIADLVRSK
jgi:endonuclease/exonuclease/phosphatase (EEP) superfamily protein YafD